MKPLYAVLFTILFAFAIQASAEAESCYQAISTTELSSPYVSVYGFTKNLQVTAPVLKQKKAVSLVVKEGCMASAKLEVLNTFTESVLCRYEYSFNNKLNERTDAVVEGTLFVPVGESIKIDLKDDYIKHHLKTSVFVKVSLKSFHCTKAYSI